MWISKRRLRAIAVGLLVSCLLLVVRPVRLWIEQAWIAQAISPQLTVGELVVHTQQAIIEAKDLAWRSDDSSPLGNTGPNGNQSVFGASVGRCWLALDRDSLSHGNLRLPKVVLQDANFYLESNLSSASDSPEYWCRRLSRRFAEFDWSVLEQELHCLSAVETLRATYCQRIERWVERSNQIQAEAAQLEHQVEAMDNPLRFEKSIEAKLARFEQLAEEQRALVGHLDEMQGDLAIESAQLNQLHQQDRQSLAQRSTVAELTPVIESRFAQFEKEFAVVLGNSVWIPLAPFGEIVDRVSRAAASFRADGDYNVTVRPTDFGAAPPQRSEFKSTGEFDTGRFKSPYQTVGTSRFTQRTPTETIREFSSVTTFQIESNQLYVSAQYDSHQSSNVHLQIGMAGDPQLVAKPADSSPSDQPVDSIPSVQATLASEPGKLTGSLSVAPSLLKLLSGDLPVELRESIAAGSDQLLRFNLSGTWHRPQIALDCAAPTWLVRAVEKIAIQQSQAAIAKSRMRLDKEFTARLQQLRQLVDVTLRDAKQATAADQRKLLASQSRMREKFDLNRRTEFARGPGEINR